MADFHPIDFGGFVSMKTQEGAEKFCSWAGKTWRRMFVKSKLWEVDMTTVEDLENSFAGVDINEGIAVNVQAINNMLAETHIR